MFFPTVIVKTHHCLYLCGLVLPEFPWQQNWSSAVLGTELHLVGKMFPKSLFKQINFFSIFSLLKGRDGDGFPVFQEKFIRECIRKFPYCDATLLQQLVRSIAPVEIVSNSDDSASNNNFGLNYRFVVWSVILIKAFSPLWCHIFCSWKDGMMYLCIWNNFL